MQPLEPCKLADSLFAAFRPDGTERLYVLLLLSDPWILLPRQSALAGAAQATAGRPALQGHRLCKGPPCPTNPHHQAHDPDVDERAALVMHHALPHWEIPWPCPCCTTTADGADPLDHAMPTIQSLCKGLNKTWSIVDEDSMRLYVEDPGSATEHPPNDVLRSRHPVRSGSPVRSALELHRQFPGGFTTEN